MQNSKIEWTHHTFNPWWGCQRVSPGCEHCYAETLAHRYNYRVWGPAKTTGRRMMSENYWKQPHKWNKAAQAAGERHRVFCASMADVFEDHPDVVEARRRLLNLIMDTPHLDWLLLTKRPENIHRMLFGIWESGPPHNVWIGTSVENQEQADKRIPILLGVPAAVRFLSCEPLLGPVDLDATLARAGYSINGWNGLHWVIVGGESGHGARPMHPDWARSLRDQCQAAGVAFHFKQWGEWAPGEYQRDGVFNGYWQFQTGKAFHEAAHGTPEDQYFQGPPDGDYSVRTTIRPWPDVACVRLSKGWAGRVLDGRTWDEVPA